MEYRIVMAAKTGLLSSGGTATENENEHMAKDANNASTLKSKRLGLVWAKTNSKKEGFWRLSTGRRKAEHKHTKHRRAQDRTESRSRRKQYPPSTEN